MLGKSPDPVKKRRQSDKDDRSSNIIINEFHHSTKSETANDQIFHQIEHDVIPSRGNPAVTFAWHPGQRFNKLFCGVVNNNENISIRKSYNFKDMFRFY